MPTDIIDITAQFPLKAESPETILARMQADLNAGVDPADPLYADALPGSVWDDFARADALEMDRVYDRMHTEVPANVLPTTATGEWLDMWADAVGLERTAAVAASGVAEFLGADGTEVAAGTQVSTEAPTPDAEPITYQTVESGVIVGGSFDTPIVAVDEGSAGSVSANAVTILDTPISGPAGEPVSVTNPNAITGGADVETDERLQKRVGQKLAGVNGAGNVDYYRNVALNYPGVGYVTVQPNTPSVGHVTVTISDVHRDPAPALMVAGLQQLLDPSISAGQGAGLAAPGATVTVNTPADLLIAVVATIVPDAGYSVGGAGGTESLAPAIAAAITLYLQTLGAGDDVIHNKVLAAIVDVEGVADATALTLNGSGTNVPVDTAHVAVLQLPLTLT